MPAFGVATGHDDNYGRFLIGTGPYMFEGTDQLDFSLPPEDQDPVTGYDVGRSIVLVRNPSYDPDSDDLREGYVDRIEVVIGGDSNDLALKVDAGELDMVYDGVPPAAQIRQYASDPGAAGSDPLGPVRRGPLHRDEPREPAVRRPERADRAELRPRQGGVPPAAWRSAVRRARRPHHGEQPAGGPAEGLRPLPDTERTRGRDGGQGGHGRVRIRHGSATACATTRRVEGIVTIIDEADPYPKQTALLQQTLEPLGITLDVKTFERTTMYSKCEDPNSHWALCPSVSWGKDYPDGFTFGPPLFSQDAIGPESCCNDPMVGATPDILRGRGYDPSIPIPSAEDQIDECIPLSGDQRLECWAQLDRYLMEDVVPWVPYLFDNNVVVVSDRVVAWSFDQFAGLPAIDRHRARVMRRER